MNTYNEKKEEVRDGKNISNIHTTLPLKHIITASQEEYSENNSNNIDSNNMNISNSNEDKDYEMTNKTFNRIESKILNQSYVSKKELGKDYNNDQLYEESLNNSINNSINNSFINSNSNNNKLLHSRNIDVYNNKDNSDVLIHNNINDINFNKASDSNSNSNEYAYYIHNINNLKHLNINNTEGNVNNNNTGLIDTERLSNIDLNQNTPRIQEFNINSTGNYREDNLIEYSDDNDIHNNTNKYNNTNDNFKTNNTINSFNTFNSNSNINNNDLSNIKAISNNNNNTTMNTLLNNINSINNINNTNTSNIKSIIHSNNANISNNIITNNLNKDLNLPSTITINDFTSIKIIGKGAFGEVRVVRFNLTKEIFAIKLISRNEMIKKNQIKHIIVERDILANANSDWIVPLKLAFQDDEFLYLVMEFMPGGDLMSLLMQEEVFCESTARLYAAELVLAIETIHDLKAIHRDIKPDNVLIDKFGHIKLSDFGLSRVIVRMINNNLLFSYYMLLYRVESYIVKAPRNILKIIKTHILLLKV